ncbi:MAG TPA: hypothetical protein VJG66_02555 [Patescibacteria group bacterium]|nr:hypothetical protein [Patescibacteria group bacterium]
MTARIIISIPVLYFLTLLQGSFLPHFAIFGHAPNIIFILIILSVFFLPADRQGLPSFSLISAISGGIFLDIFSNHFLGFNVLILTGTVFFIESVFKKYVQIPIR